MSTPKKPEYRHIGKYRPRKEAREIVTDKCVYLDDFKMKDMLHAKLMPSPYAHAMIKDIDTSAAEALPGVCAVVTYKNQPEFSKEFLQGLPPVKKVCDQHLRYVGDCVALVAADTEELCEEAIRLIKVDYEVTTLLTEQDLSLESVPREGQHVGLRRMANGSAGGDIVDVTDELPSAIKDAAVRAVHVFDNIHIAGVDLLRRPSESGEDSYVIIEMNSRPHIPTNMYPSVGTGRDVPRHFIDHFFPETPRASQPGDDSLVYDYPAAETLQRTRVTSSVTLRPLPEHRYPVRRFVHLVTGDEYVNMPRIRRERLESRAERLDIVGDITQPEREVVHAKLGASDEESMQAFVTLLTEALRGRVIESSPHTGILTTGMRIARPLLGRKR